MPSVDRDRRALLIGLGGAVVLAGCQTGDDQSDTDSPSSTGSETATTTQSPTPSGQFSLTPTDPRAAEEPVTVLPADLPAWLRDVATADTTVREHAGVDFAPAVQAYEPIPPLPVFDRVEIDDPGGDAGGRYDFDAEGGVRYDLLVGAEAVSPPEDAEVTPISELSGERREIALAAVGAESDRDRRVYPETELGSWARTAFFGGYYRYDGTTYRGNEVQQTDAAFFSKRIWYVISASETDAEASVTLALDEVDSRVRAVVDELRGEHETIEPMARRVEGETAAVLAAFAEGGTLLLTHEAVYRAAFED
ncbi:hypothetical protein B4589_000180 [Halolamina sp. CBA1230]|uniref:hypothetical protein n=1 Tax=Halolamina sp. CBA1230 TaxID=1853690 RepID=UPI0009A22D09|nr:hypothetical protein [Halolamina sp. CBA1230]QKY18860.1 hypothetical protein B4589_000180 [Halolamina sp. CBA1230]